MNRPPSSAGLARVRQQDAWSRLHEQPAYFVLDSLNVIPLNPPEVSKYLHLLEERQQDLLRLGVRQIGLFGSCVRGDERADSDVDILVEFAAGRKTLGALVDLGDYLESLFHRRVEVVTLESLSPYMGPNILSEVQYAQFAA